MLRANICSRLLLLEDFAKVGLQVGLFHLQLPDAEFFHFAGFLQPDLFGHCPLHVRIEVEHVEDHRIARCSWRRVSKAIAIKRVEGIEPILGRWIFHHRAVFARLRSLVLLRCRLHPFIFELDLIQLHRLLLRWLVILCGQLWKLEFLEANLADGINLAFQILLLLILGVLGLLGALVEGIEILQFLHDLPENLLVGLLVTDLAVQLLLLHEQVHLQLVLVRKGQEDLDVVGLAAEGGEEELLAVVGLDGIVHRLDGAHGLLGESWERLRNDWKSEGVRLLHWAGVGICGREIGIHR